MEFVSNSNTKTLEIGKQIASTLCGGDIIFLHGELGTGKTTLTKGIAKGLNIETDITSPTFTLMNIYDIPKNANGIKQLIHIDTYRMETAQDLIDIGVEDYLGAPDTVTIVEWPEKIESLLAGKKIKRVVLEHDENDGRKITLENF